MTFEYVPPVRDSVRVVAWWLVVGVVVGALAGGLIGGVGGRLVMLGLRLASDADGVVSDDGFTIGRFTLSDSLQLYAAMALAGAINGAAYVGVRSLLPARGRVPLWGLVGAAVLGGVFVKTEGVDFTVLEPRWFAVAAFVCLPGLAALAVAWVVERAARLEPWRCSRWLALLLLPASPALIGAPLFLLGAAAFVGLGRVEALRRLRDGRLPRFVALGLLGAMIVAGGADVVRDALEIL